MTNMKQVAQVVSIAGVDSGGGAGLQADLKTFQMQGVYGMNIVIALTAQNTLGVQAALPIPEDFIDQEFTSLASDFKISACKTGMLFDSSHIETVVKNLKEHDFGPLVVDPVMIAKGGSALLKDDAIITLRSHLLPLASLVTPNIPEAEVLLNCKFETTDDIQKGARDLQKLGVKNVIIKGGHGRLKEQVQDYVLLEDGSSFWMTAPRIDTKNTHGTGDTLSAAIVANLAKGENMRKTIILARQYVQGCIQDGISVGHGHGPLNHWAESKFIHISQ